MGAGMGVAANIAMLFDEVPFLDRFAAAANAGFTAVEMWWPDGIDPGVVRRTAHDAGVQIIRLALATGPRGGLVCQPDLVAAFRYAANAALDLATDVGCRMLNAHAGVRSRTHSLEHQLDCGRRNLEWLADRAADRGITVLVEPNSRTEKPGYLIGTVTEAQSLIDAVRRPNVALLFDAYHVHVAGDDVGATFAAHLPSIQHVQIADAPGRHEPGTGRVGYPALLHHFWELGYRGMIGLEYRPLAGTLAGLGWLPVEARSRGLDPTTLPHASA